MDREKIVKITQLYYFGKLPKEDIIDVITNYCLEHNKFNNDISMFLSKIVDNNIVLSYYFSIALSYYKRKFNIIELYNKQNPLDPFNGINKIIQIF